MGIFLRSLWKQKPGIYGPPSAVQRNIWMNAERAGIDPGSIVLCMPMWGPGDQIDYAQQYMSNNLGAVYTKNKLFFDGTNDYINIGARQWLGGATSDNPVSFFSVFTPNNLTNPLPIISTYRGPLDCPFFGVSGGSDLSLILYDASGNDRIGRISDAPITTNERVIFTATYNGSLTDTGILLYKNGLAVSTSHVNDGSYDGIYESSDYIVGARWVGDGHLVSAYHSGYIDIVLVYNRVLTHSQIAHLSDNPYFLIHRNPARTFFIPSGAGGVVTSLLDGKVIIRTASSVLLDGLATIKTSASDLLDGKAIVKTASTDDLDGKTIIQSVATAVFDGKASVQSVASDLLDGKTIIANTGTDLLDGKGVVRSATTVLLDGKGVFRDTASNLIDGKGVIKTSASDLLDGKGIVKATATDLFDGKSIISSAATNNLDGKVIVNAEGFGNNLLDGKTIIKSVATNHLDGLIYISSIADNTLDGKTIIKSSAELSFDGKATIKDIASDLLDGSATIKTNVVNIVDGKAVITDSVIGLLDGKAIIQDDSTILLDGKVFISSGSETNVLDGKIIISVPIVGKVSVTFSMKTPAVTFSMKTPSATFTIK